MAQRPRQRGVHIRRARWRRVARPRVVLDANALMMPFQFSVNLDVELRRLVGDCDAVVPSSVVRELARLAPRDRTAKAALALAGKYAVHETAKTGDAAVVEAAVALRAPVVTNDQALLAALQRAGIPRITLRSKSHLVLEG